MSEKKVFRYAGEQIEVAWNGRLCLHVQECTRAAGDLFESGRNPWCRPELAEGPDHVAEVVRRCPTGALSYRREAGEEERPPGENTVVVSNRGPLYVTGQLEIEGADEEMPGVRFRAALCRCGASKTKPFCDNSHERVEFRDRGAVGESGDDQGGRGGRLEIRPAPNGPLLLTGNMRIVSGGGRVAWQGRKTALCRCGHSANKPFCDGSHKARGFTAD